MRKCLATLIVLIAFSAEGVLVSAGKLSDVRKSVREEESKSESKKKDKKRKRSSSKRRDRDDNDFSWLSFSLSLFTSEPSRSNSQQATYSEPIYSEPVYAAGPPVIVTDETPAPYLPPSPPPRPPVPTPDGWLNRFTFLGGTDFESLDHGSIAWLAQSPNSLGIDASLTTFRESTTTIRDQLWLGDANLVFEPIFGDLRARIGVGFNWLHDSIGTEFGGNLTAGFDFAAFDSFMLTGEIDAGALGDAGLFHGQISAGYQIGITELFAGYNYYDIGGSKLDGTIFGLRFRF